MDAKYVVLISRFRTNLIMVFNLSDFREIINHKNVYKEYKCIYDNSTYLKLTGFYEHYNSYDSEYNFEFYFDVSDLLHNYPEIIMGDA